MEEMARLVVVADVVVEFPVIVRLPLMVEEAEEINPAVNWRSVEVELPREVGVKGKICDSEVEDILLLKSDQSAEVRKPLVEAADAWPLV